jgi:hypothetical protein
MPLPSSRETLLHFFDQMQRGFPTMTRFRRTEAGEMNLEEDRSQPSYRWLSVESKRLCSGHVNPPSIEEAMRIHTTALTIAPHQLGLSSIEIEYLDILFGFDLEFTGNHDEVIAESLLADTPLSCLTEEAGARPVDFQPSVTVSLSEDCRLQARIDVVTRTNSYQVRTGDYADDVISVYLIVRRYWGDRPRQPLEQMAVELADRAQSLCSSQIVSRVLRPISNAIASR